MSIYITTASSSNSHNSLNCVFFVCWVKVAPQDISNRKGRKGSSSLFITDKCNVLEAQLPPIKSEDTAAAAIKQEPTIKKEPTPSPAIKASGLVTSEEVKALITKSGGSMNATAVSKHFKGRLNVSPTCFPQYSFPTELLFDTSKS